MPYADPERQKEAKREWARRRRAEKKAQKEREKISVHIKEATKKTAKFAEEVKQLQNTLFDKTVSKANDNLIGSTFSIGEGKPIDYDDLPKTVKITTFGDKKSE